MTVAVLDRFMTVRERAVIDAALKFGQEVNELAKVDIEYSELRAGYSEFFDAVDTLENEQKTQ